MNENALRSDSELRVETPKASREFRPRGVEALQAPRRVRSGRGVPFPAGSGSGELEKILTSVAEMIHFLCTFDMHMRNFLGNFLPLVNKN